MSMLRTSTLCYITFFLINQCYFTMVTFTNAAVTGTDEAKPRVINVYHYAMNKLIERASTKYVDSVIKDRYKRQTVAGDTFFLSAIRYKTSPYDQKEPGQRNKPRADKFKDAASSSPIKTLRQFLTFFHNLFTNDPSGGNHPMSKENPKIVVGLFKSSIYDVVFPEPSKV